MASFNKVLLMGNLTRDPQLKYLPSQTAVVEFGIACNRKFRTANGEDKEEVTYVDITSFGKQAEVINQYFQKGKPIFIEGRLKFDSWEDKQGGGGYEDAPPRRSGPPQQRGPQRGPQQQQRPQQEPPFSEEQQFKDDDIPF